jgi:sarcosine oxidase subunit beta
LSRTTDVLIVGGGVIGASIAFHLARRRAGRVVLLEKAFLSAGSSGKSGAIIRQHYSNALTARMARDSLRVFEHFDDVVGGPPVFTRSGMVLVVSNRDRAALEANLKMQRGLGIDTRLLSPAELRSIDPHVQIAEDELAAHEREAGFVESVQAVASFAEAARKHGAEIRERIAVQSLVLQGSRVIGARTNEGLWEARKIILATGPWAAQLALEAGVTIPVQACRTQVALVRKPAGFGAPGPVYGDFVRGSYFKPTHGELVHAGTLTGEELQQPVDPDSYRELADEDWVRGVRQAVAARYPAMKRGIGRGGFGALYAITPDWHPIIDRLPGIEGAYCAVGFSGHGFKLSPLVGQLVSEMVLDGQASSFDIRALRFPRFSENDPVTTPYSYGVMG